MSFYVLKNINKKTGGPLEFLASIYEDGSIYFFLSKLTVVIHGDSHNHRQRSLLHIH